MTAKKRSDKRERTVVRYVRLSPAEDAIVVAKAAGNISGFFRTLALDKRMAPSAVDRDAIGRLMRNDADTCYEMRKIGNNINQYAKSRNAGRASDNLDLAMMAALEELAQAIRTIEERRLVGLQALGHERERKSKDED